jgi:hypothetical protein
MRVRVQEVRPVHNCSVWVGDGTNEHGVEIILLGD